jgi:hypothetical protein
MSKKMTLLGLIVVALTALVVPAAASATPQLFNQTTNTAVPVPSTLMGTSTDAVTTETKLGTLTCKKVSIGAKLTKNNGTVIEAEDDGEGTNSTEGCLANGSIPVVIDNPTLISLKTDNTTTDKGTLSLSYKATIGSPNPVICPFTGTGEFEYKTGTGNDVLTIPTTKGIELEGPELCKKAGVKPKFHGTFTLEVDTGGVGTGPFDPVYVK